MRGVRGGPDRLARFNGHWLAYRSDYSGTYEVYVEAYPGPGARKMISTDGGSYERWSRDGKELFYSVGGKMIAVDLQTQPKFVAVAHDSAGDDCQLS